MKVKDFCEKLDMKVLTESVEIHKNISGVYICDLLSWVMSHASKEDAWITIHTHVNIVAVAVLTEVACIIVPEGIQVEEDTIKRANKEGILILSTNMSGYEICWKTHELIGS